MPDNAIAFSQSEQVPEGRFGPKSEVRISPDDRGFMFADGVYEVIRSYRGRLFCLAEHTARLSRSLGELRIKLDQPERIPELARTLLERNELTTVDGTVYIQVTRGAFPRQHVFPKQPVVPTLYMEANRLLVRPGLKDGVACCTYPDIRWTRCDIKSIALLPNILAGQHAAEHGCYEALFVRDVCLTEGSHTSIFAVNGRTLITHELDNSVLPGITRNVILKLAAELGLGLEERAVRAEELASIDELFLSCTTAEVLPVVSVDARPVGSGKPGPVTLQLASAFRNHVETWLRTRQS